MENFIKTLIYIHAFFGGIGLIAGTVIMFAKKGNQLHVKAGKIFSIGMLISTILSFIVCIFPNHHNSFLVLIGIFTIYMILLGNRVTKYKKKNYKNALNQYISYGMFFAGIVMIAIAIYYRMMYEKLPVLFIIFGVLSAFMASRDFKFYNDSENHKKWVKSHVGKMVGAYIASVTAFIVAGLGLGENFYAWILPTVIGTIYIIAWGRKLNKKTCDKLIIFNQTLDMKYFYFFLILILFLGCAKNKTSWPTKVEIPKEIKDEKFYNTLQQVIDITEKNNIEVYNINVTFTENQIYFFTSEVIEDCMYGDYYQLPIKINQKDYALILRNNKFLINHIDLKNLKYVSDDQEITMICDFFDGLAFAYRKNEIGEYQLIKVLHYDFLNDDFILEEDQEYFPRRKFIMEEPEPEPPIEEIK